jgi:hypothetical protein
MESAAGRSADDAQRALAVARRATQHCVIPQSTVGPLAADLGDIDYWR